MWDFILLLMLALVVISVAYLTVFYGQQWQRGKVAMIAAARCPAGYCSRSNSRRPVRTALADNVAEDLDDERVRQV